jgi:putative phosphoribosyl transferase
VPGHAELAMGAIASGGIRILNDGIIAALGIPSAAIAVAAVREEEELERRESAYRRAGTEAAAVQGKTVILIDDGLATGASMRAAIAAVRARHPSKVVVAVPTAAPDTAALVEEEVDELVCLLKPASFSAVGMWYVDFEQTTDEEVTALLLQAADFGGYNL